MRLCLLIWRKEVKWVGGCVVKALPATCGQAGLRQNRRSSQRRAADKVRELLSCARRLLCGASELSHRDGHAGFYRQESKERKNL